MVEFVKECCGCAVGAYPCAGSACTFGSMIFICDECGDEVSRLWEYEDMELCERCLLAAVPEVTA